MAGLTFFFDPLCPWAWRTSRWIREVQHQQGLVVRWRFFSLAIHNNYREERPETLTPLRVAALAGREGGNEAVDRVYQALGNAFHERGEDMSAEGALARLTRVAVTDAGMDPALVERALADTGTLRAVEDDHREGRERHAAFGVPWLVPDGQDLGFFGPILDVPPAGQESVELWEHTLWLLGRPYLYELKRERH